jgi:hypothetical protein
MFLKYIVSQVSKAFRLQGSDVKMILVSFGDVEVVERAGFCGYLG